MRGPSAPRHRAVAGAALVERYATRLVPPVLAAVLVEGRAIDPTLDRVRVEWSNGGVGEVALRGPVVPFEDGALRPSRP